MIQNLIKLEHDMDQVIHGVNKLKKKFFNYQIILLLVQIVIINFSNAGSVGFDFLNNI